jgi:hypothetical protein
MVVSAAPAMDLGGYELEAADPPAGTFDIGLVLAGLYRRAPTPRASSIF